MNVLTDELLAQNKFACGENHPNLHPIKGKMALLAHFFFILCKRKQMTHH